MLPTVIGLAVFTVVPFIAAVVLSFTEWSLIGEPVWVGFDNYAVLLRDSVFGSAWINTAIYTLVSVPLSMAIGLALAMLLNRKLPGMGLFRTLFFVPMTVGIVSVGLLWAWIFTPEYGILNYVLTSVGLQPQPWLTSESTSLISMIIVGAWRAIGFTIIVFLAGLQGIPAHLYEAASIDGAGAFAKLRHVTLPMLSPTTFFVALIGVIMSFQVFEQTYVMTQGGPGNSTLTIIYLIFQEGFNHLRMGYASAISVTFLVVLALGTALMLRFQSRWVHYEN
jgi:multiple sugar transport system permease protein